MVQVKLDPQWVPKSKCPLKAAIVSIEEIPETIKGRPYTTLRLMIENKGQMYQYDAKFGDKNFLVNTLGADSEKWIGQEITIEVNEETGYKQIALRK